MKKKRSVGVPWEGREGQVGGGDAGYVVVKGLVGFQNKVEKWDSSDDDDPSEHVEEDGTKGDVEFILLSCLRFGFSVMIARVYLF